MEIGFAAAARRLVPMAALAVCAAQPRQPGAPLQAVMLVEKRSRRWGLNLMSNRAAFTGVRMQLVLTMVQRGHLFSQPRNALC